MYCYFSLLDPVRPLGVSVNCKTCPGAITDAARTLAVFTSSTPGTFQGSGDILFVHEGACRDQLREALDDAFLHEMPMSQFITLLADQFKVSPRPPASAELA